MKLLTDRKYVVNPPVIPMNEIESILNKKINGVIHVGANYGEEANEYIRNNINNVIWIEPLSFGFNQLKQLQDEYNHKIFNCAIGNIDGELEMYVTSNNVSSSLRDLGTHKYMSPDCIITNKEIVKVYKLDTLISKYNINMSDYNLLNIDTQGTEDQVLEGADKNLANFDALYIEVNDKNVYVGCKTKNEIRSYLKDKGFELKLERKINLLQYEHLYIKK